MQATGKQNCRVAYTGDGGYKMESHAGDDKKQTSFFATTRDVWRYAI